MTRNQNLACPKARRKDREVKIMQKYEMLILLKSDLEEEAKEAELKKYA